MAHASDKPWDDPNCSPFWKSIARLRPQFNCSVASRIGNGNNTKFWHDTWLNSKLKWSFPNLYKEATNKQATVSQCIDANGWCLLFPNLSTAAQNESSLLHTCLQEVHLLLTQLQDEFTWTRRPSVFSVSSAYHFISQTPSPISHLHSIWRIRAPTRVMVFAWLLLTNRLTTVDNLVKRGWLLPNMCAMCKAAAETTHHLFTQCAAATQIRSYILTSLPHTIPLPSKFVAANSTLMLADTHESAQVRKWEITTCYILWRERCRRIFTDKEQSHMALVREIKLEIGNWFGM